MIESDWMNTLLVSQIGCHLNRNTCILSYSCSNQSANHVVATQCVKHKLLISCDFNEQQKIGKMLPCLFSIMFGCPVLVYAPRALPGWQEELMWSSEPITPHHLTCCAFWDALLLTTVVMSGYLTYQSLDVCSHRCCSLNVSRIVLWKHQRLLCMKITCRSAVSEIYTVYILTGHFYMQGVQKVRVLLHIHNFLLIIYSMYSTFHPYALCIFLASISCFYSTYSD